MAAATARPLVVVLGLGEMGAIHARHLLSHPCIRVGVASSRPVSLSGVDRTYTSYESAISDPEVHAVMIATPYPTHPKLVTSAAQAGKHIFCEKPLGHTTASILPARAALKERPEIRFQTGFQRRWDIAYQTAYDKSNAEHAGPAIALKCTSGDATYPEKYLRDGADAPVDAMLRDLAVHDIDLARWLFKDEVAKVYAAKDALSHPEIGKRGDADIGVAILHMKQSKAKVLLHFSRAFSYGYNVTSEIVRRNATFRVGELKTIDVTELANGKEIRQIAPDFAQRFDDAFRRQVEGFVKLVTVNDKEAKELMEHDPSYASFDDGLATTLVAEALVESAETDSVVKVKPFPN